MTDFSDHFRKIIMRYKRIGYNVNVMRQSACLVINPITIDGYATLFNCTSVDRASDSMMAPTLSVCVLTCSYFKYWFLSVCIISWSLLLLTLTR